MFLSSFSETVAFFLGKWNNSLKQFKAIGVLTHAFHLGKIYLVSPQRVGVESHADKIVDCLLQEPCPTCLQWGHSLCLLAWLFLSISCCRSAASSACSAWMPAGRRWGWMKRYGQKKNNPTKKWLHASSRGCYMANLQSWKEGSAPSEIYGIYHPKNIFWIFFLFFIIILCALRLIRGSFVYSFMLRCCFVFFYNIKAKILKLCGRSIHTHSQQQQSGLGLGHCSALFTGTLFFRRSSLKLLMIKDHYAVAWPIWLSNHFHIQSSWFAVLLQITLESKLKY